MSTKSKSICTFFSMTLRHVIAKKKKKKNQTNNKTQNVLGKFTILCWATPQPLWAMCSPQAAGWTPLLSQTTLTGPIFYLGTVGNIFFLLDGHIAQSICRVPFTRIMKTRTPFCKGKRKTQMPFRTEFIIKQSNTKESEERKNKEGKN